MNNRKELIISWQRLLLEGETCPRCGTTEAEVEKSFASLTSALAPLGVEVILEKNLSRWKSTSGTRCNRT